MPSPNRFEGYAPDSPFWAEPIKDSGGNTSGDFPQPETPTRAQTRLATRVAGAIALVVVGLGLVLFAVTRTPPVGSSATASDTDNMQSVVGTWNAQVVFGQSLSMQTLVIVAENLVTGDFSGNINSPVGVETITGRVAGSTMSFTIKLGTATDVGTATVSTNRNDGGRIKGNFSDPTGTHGTITATRVSL